MFACGQKILSETGIGNGVFNFSWWVWFISFYFHSFTFSFICCCFLFWPTFVIFCISFSKICWCCTFCCRLLKTIILWHTQTFPSLPFVRFVCTLKMDVLLSGQPFATLKQYNYSSSRTYIIFLSDGLKTRHSIYWRMTKNQNATKKTKKNQKHFKNRTWWNWIGNRIINVFL